MTTNLHHFAARRAIFGDVAAMLHDWESGAAPSPSVEDYVRAMTQHEPRFGRFEFAVSDFITYETSLGRDLYEVIDDAFLRFVADVDTRVAGVVEHYIDIVEVNGTVEDVLTAVAEGNVIEIAFELDETSGDEAESVGAEAGRPAWISEALPHDDESNPDLRSEQWLSVLRDAVPEVVSKLQGLEWERRLLDRFYAANPFYPAGVQVPGCDSYYWIVTEEEGFVVGLYNRSDEDQLVGDQFAVILSRFDHLVEIFDAVLDRNPEGTDYAAWALQRIADLVVDGNMTGRSL